MGQAPKSLFPLHISFKVIIVSEVNSLMEKQRIELKSYYRFSLGNVMLMRSGALGSIPDLASLLIMIYEYLKRLKGNKTMNEEFVITRYIDEDQGLVSIYCNLKLVVEWSFENPDDIESCMEDFRSILDVGIAIGSGRLGK